MTANFTNIKKSFIIYALICLIVAFIFAKGVSALMIPAQLIDEESGSGQYLPVYQTFGAGWTGQVNNYTAKLSSAGTTQVGLTFIEADFPGNPLTGLNWNFYTDSSCSNRDWLSWSNDLLWIFDFNSGYRKATSTCISNADNPIILDASKQYTSWYGRNDGDQFSLYGSISDVYADGDYFLYDGSPDGNIADSYFIFDEENQPYVERYTPLHGASLYEQPIEFTGIYGNPTMEYNFIRLNIWETTSRATTTLTQYIGTSTDGSYIINNIIDDGYYEYTAQLYNATTSASTTPTEIWQFAVGATGFADVCDGLDLTSVVGSIECALKRVVRWSFYPSNDATNYFTRSYDRLTDKIPFSLLYDITDTMKTAISSTATTSDDTLGVPMIRNTATSTEFYILPVLASSSLPSAVGDSNALMIRTTIGYVLWLATGAFILIIIFPSKKE